MLVRVDRTKPCNQHVQRIVCSLHDLIVRPSVVHQFDGTANEPKATVDQAAADREALARVMFGPGANWASTPRMKRLLDSTIELGFPQTCGYSQKIHIDGIWLPQVKVEALLTFLRLVSYNPPGSNGLPVTSRCTRVACRCEDGRQDCGIRAEFGG